MPDHLATLCRLIESMGQSPDTAAQVHAAIGRRLRPYFNMIMEFPVERGRIDIVVKSFDGLWQCAIEIDARRPRARSLLKLRAFDGAKVVALRGVTALLPEGIDAVVNVPVRTATDLERFDKRTVSRL